MNAILREKFNIIVKLLLLIKHSFSMMFIILTHDNQSALSSFSLFLSFVSNVAWLKKSSLVSLIWAWL